ncbi:MAG: 4Fe-4S binding protein [Elusimicrobiota bacterium]|nr:4Fe-4S binding protein [Elusimicrobiota bacterium]
MKKEENRKLTAAELPAGGLVEAGTAANFHTGSWRSEKPVWNKDKCISCLTCWISCPDSAILTAQDEKKGTVVSGIDYDFCKGCGICVRECPPKVQALTMEQEKK